MTVHCIPLGANLFAARDRGLGTLREPKNLALFDRLDAAARGEWFRKCPALLEHIVWVRR